MLTVPIFKKTTDTEWPYIQNLFVKPKAEAKIIWVMLRREKDY